MAKPRRLLKREVVFISRRLEGLDVDIMEAFVVKQVEAVEFHVACYEERQALWSYLKESNKLGRMMKFLRDTFFELFREHSTGAERFGRLLAAWYQKTGALACAAMSTRESCELWGVLTSDFDREISALDRSALVSAIAAAAYTFFQKQVTDLQSTWRAANLSAIDESNEVVSDDDASLYRLFGFSLYVGIQFRKETLYGRLRQHYLPNTRRKYRLELEVMKTLVETDKSVCPAVIQFQDRGKMTFSHQALFPFLRRCSIAIKTNLNRKQFLLQGRTVVLTTKREVLNNQDLLREFSTLASFRCGEVDTATIKGVYLDLVRRVINTMANSFLSSQDMLARITANKGVDAQMTLRDKLKAYASDVQCRIQL